MPGGQLCFLQAKPRATILKNVRERTLCHIKSFGQTASSCKQPGLFSSVGHRPIRLLRITMVGKGGWVRVVVVVVVALAVGAGGVPIAAQQPAGLLQGPRALSSSIQGTAVNW